MLLEIDGKIVPNYAATMVSFDEGDVVNGKVVRIDKDEVLVDIGYKAEGVIPSNELSIRKSVDPADEVELGEEVDALVLTKEDAEGRLDPLQEARSLREGLAPDRGRRRVRASRSRAP